MHSTQNWFGISKRRPRRDWGVWERGEEAQMDRETKGERRTQTARKTQEKKWRHKKEGKGNPKK